MFRKSLIIIIIFYLDFYYSITCNEGCIIEIDNDTNLLCNKNKNQTCIHGSYFLKYNKNDVKDECGFCRDKLGNYSYSCTYRNESICTERKEICDPNYEIISINGTCHYCENNMKNGYNCIFDNCDSNGYINPFNYNCICKYGFTGKYCNECVHAPTNHTSICCYEFKNWYLLTVKNELEYRYISGLYHEKKCMKIGSKIDDNRYLNCDCSIKNFNNSEYKNGIFWSDKNDFLNYEMNEKVINQNIINSTLQSLMIQKRSDKFIGEKNLNKNLLFSTVSTTTPSETTLPGQIIFYSLIGFISLISFILYVYFFTRMTNDKWAIIDKK